MTRARDMANFATGEIFTSADHTKLDGIATGATASTTYVHPTGNGNNHIPVDGASGQALLYASAGTAAWGVAKTAGKETIWVPASAMQPTVSNGCSALTPVETTAGRPDMVVLDFDASADEFAQFSVGFPKSWDEGTVTFQFYWSSIAATTGVVMKLEGVAVGDNDTIDVAYGTAVSLLDDAQGAVEEMLVSPESTAITIAGSPAVDQLCYFRIGRNVSDSNDDMAGDCRLHGIKIFFTTDAASDA